MSNFRDYQSPIRKLVIYFNHWTTLSLSIAVKHRFLTTTRVVVIFWNTWNIDWNWRSIDCQSYICPHYNPKPPNPRPTTNRIHTTQVGQSRRFEVMSFFLRHHSWSVTPNKIDRSSKVSIIRLPLFKTIDSTIPSKGIASRIWNRNRRMPIVVVRIAFIFYCLGSLLHYN